ncbi:MAG: transglycosylase SLT domain-containing protein [Betaproteobacteria bacterium]
MKLALFAVAAVLVASGSPASRAATEADVLLAKEAAQKGHWKALDALRPRFAGDILEPYPAYWLLAGSVDRADPNEVRAFLDRYPGTPLAESLRREWLKALGAARSWDTFREQVKLLVGDDTEITCYAFQERLERGDADAVGETRTLFLSARETPGACDAVFGSLVASGAISEDDVWQRLYKVLAATNAREAKETNALLPKAHRLNEKLLDRASADPAKFLAHEKADTLLRPARALAFYAVARLARTRPDEAAERLEAVAPRLGADLTKAAWAQVAWQAALAHHPRALEWYALAGDTALTDAQIAWRARAALRAGDWKQVLAAIQAMSPEEAREASWRYWRARALRKLGEPQAADLLLQGVAREMNFYGLLAADEIGVAPSPDWTAWHPQKEDFDRVRSMEGIRRALALYRAGLDNEGLREWLWAVRGLPDRDLLTAAEIARQNNVRDRAINTADRTVQLHDFTQRYPLPHRDSLDAASREWALDEAILYSLIRQESRFVAEARSRAGAVGLMQLMPATAKWVARQLPVHPFKVDMLSKPDVNIRMGTYYFRRVLSALGHPILATAAYNAGPGRARRWRDERPLEGAIYAETIPFNETRDYVKKVFANAWFYRHRLSGKTPSMRELLGLVPGRNGEAPDPVAANLP